MKGGGLHRGHMISGVEACLKRLDTDYLDILYLHAPDYNTPIEETMEAATQLVKSGKVRYIGVSNYAAWQIVDLIRTGEKINGVTPVVTQDCYNLITRSIDRELVPCIEEHVLGWWSTVRLPVACLLKNSCPANQRRDPECLSINSIMTDSGNPPIWKRYNRSPPSQRMRA